MLKNSKGLRDMLREYAATEGYNELKDQIDIIITKEARQYEIESKRLNRRFLDEIAMEVEELFAFHERNTSLLNSINVAFASLPTNLLSTVKGPMSLSIMSKYTNIPEEAISLYLSLKDFEIDYHKRSVVETAALLSSALDKLKEYDLVPETIGTK